MNDSGRHRRVRGAFFRVLFAVALLVVASFQPWMIAMAKSAAESTQADLVLQDQAHDHHGAGAQSGGDETASGGDVHHRGAATADLCCDMHCMPSAGVPPCLADLGHPSSGSFGTAVAGSLTPGETQGLIRPPRT